MPIQLITLFIYEPHKNFPHLQSLIRKYDE
uniref:Uncharacterized protein n=1 Tax=Rhizophora mucronata TaxID=61149 RepID=A0A2P2NKT6_RHIMU